MQTVSHHSIGKQGQVDCQNVYSGFSFSVFLFFSFFFFPCLIRACSSASSNTLRLFLAMGGRSSSWAGWTQEGRAAHGGGERRGTVL